MKRLSWWGVVPFFVQFLVLLACGGGGGGSASDGTSNQGAVFYDGHFSGQVINAADGLPAPYIGVEIRDKDGFFYGRFWANEKGEVSDGGGLQMLGPIVGGTITAYYFKEPKLITGLSPVTLPFSLEAGGTHSPIRLVVSKGLPMEDAIISGRVTNAAGVPVANISVMVWGVMGVRDGRDITSTTLEAGQSGTDGRFMMKFPLAAKTRCLVGTGVTAAYQSVFVNQLAFAPGQSQDLGTIIVSSR